MSSPPIKYVAGSVPCPEGYCSACWAARRVIPLRPNASGCWVCCGMKAQQEPEIEAPRQATLEMEIP